MSSHKVEVWLVVDGSPSALDVTSATMTNDESWQPYVQVQVGAVGSVARFADPRAGHLLKATFTDTGSGSSVTADNLSVRTVDVDQETGAVRLTAASAEAAVQDLAYLGAAQLGPLSWAGIREALEDLLGNYIGVAPARLDLSGLPYGTSPELVTGTTFQPGDRWWSTVQDLPRRIGWSLWVGLDGIWRLSPTVPAVPPVAVGNLAVGDTLEALTAATTREDESGWADAAVVNYAWTDAANVAHKIVGTARRVTTPTRVTTVTAPVPVTQVQADARAAEALNLATQRGQVLNLATPARYDVQVRGFWDVTTPAAVYRCYVSRLDRAMPTASTTMTLRVVTTTATPTVRWVDVDPRLRWVDVDPAVRWVDVDNSWPTVLKRTAA